MKMTTETAEIAMNICEGIARSQAFKFLDKTADEIAEELIFHLVNVQSKKDVQLDPDLMAVICYRHIVDIQRKGIRKSNNETTVDMSNSNVTGDSEISSVDPAYMVNTDFCSNLHMKNLFEMFDKDSQEAIFLRFWGTKIGLIDDPEFDDCKKFNESELAWKLGYSGTSHRAFKSFRAKMQDFIKKYFLIED